MSRALTCGLLAVCACSETRLFDGEVPPEIHSVIAVLEYDDGTVIIGPRASRPGVSFPFERGRTLERVQALGYTEEALRPIFGALPAENSARLAAGCDVRLPPPAWVGDETAPVPDLTADTPDCPGLAVPAFDARCGLIDNFRPGITAERCALEVSHGAETVGAVVDRARGDICLPANPQSCLRVDPLGGAWAAFECQNECRVDLFSDIGQNDLEVLGFEVGIFLADAVALDDRLVVADLGDAVNVLNCASDLHTTPTKLHMWTLETLSQITFATAPPCLTRLAAVPGAQTFLGVFGLAPTLSLGEFDRDGQLLRQVPIPSAAKGVIGLVLTSSASRAAALLQLEQGSVLEIFDTQTLQHLRSISLEYTKTRALTNAGPWGVALTNGDPDLVVILDFENDKGTEHRLATGLTILPESLSFDSTRQLLLVADSGGDPEILVYDQTIQRGKVPFFEPRPKPTAVHAPRNGLPLATLALTGSDGRTRTLAATFDPIAERYLLTPKEAGDGTVSRIVEDQIGRFWLVFPSPGRITRVTVR